MGRVPGQRPAHAAHSIMVNRRGRRFTNEAANYNTFGGAFHVEDVSRFEYANLPVLAGVRPDVRRTLRLPGHRRRRRRPVPDWVPAATRRPSWPTALGIDGDELERTDRAVERQLRRRPRPRLRPRRQRLRLLVGRPAPQGTARRHARPARHAGRTTRTRSTAARSAPRAGRGSIPTRGSLDIDGDRSPGSTPPATSWGRRSG